ncbi:MAG: hypothetical protein JWN34_1609 [Bryobacterales bacterium]|nr:hypothetical protein [Bryobacterales bacterium]
MPADACVRFQRSRPRHAVSVLSSGDEQPYTTAVGVVLICGARPCARTLKFRFRNGVTLLSRRPNGPNVTTQLVKRLRDEDE